MPPEVAEAFAPLWHEVVWLHVTWKEQLALYEDSEVIRLLNRTADHFFYLVQRIMWRDTLLGICRLMDPAETSGKSNLSLYRLIDAVPDTELLARCRTRLQQARMNAREVFEWRNRSLAHNDFRTKLRRHPDPLQPVRKSAIAAALAAIADTMNAIDVHYSDHTTAYDHPVLGSGADALLFYLRRAEQALAEEDR